MNWFALFSQEWRSANSRQASREICSAPRQAARKSSFSTPIGLSAITRLAMPGMVSTMMGLWFLGTAGGDFLAQEVGKLVSIDPSVTGASSNLGDYVTLFAVLTAVGTIASAVLFLAQPWLGRLSAHHTKTE